MKTNLIMALVISILIVSCKNKTDEATDTDSNLIEITKAQFESEKMMIGEPLLYPFSDVVHFTGNIITAVDGQAQISLTLPGIINRIYCKSGQMINKGASLFEVSGNEFVDLQKDFAESSAIVLRLKSDYLRAKELHNDNIATQKDFNYAESNYLAENARYKALKIKLEGIGLDVSKIVKGDFYSSYTVKSPISGVISGINTTMGQYVDPQQKIAEIIDIQTLQLRFSVFEKNINKIKIGQLIDFYLNANKSEQYKASIIAVGKTILSDSKSIECFAEIHKYDAINLINNQFVEGDVYTTVDSVMSVPETAIVKSESDSYLLVFEKEEKSIYYFRKIKISTGRKANNQVEITGKIPSGKLLVNGIYNIQIE